MQYQVYDSAETLLAPKTLTMLTGHDVTYVRCLPMQGGNSGAQLLAIEASNDTSCTRYILKRMTTACDWVMRVSADHQCRSVRLWQYGLLDRLQPTIDHAIIACAHAGDEYLLLMHDKSAQLVTKQTFTATEVYRLLDALAFLHASFWNDPVLTDPELGLCDQLGVLEIFSPMVAHNFPSESSPLPQWLKEGWILLQEMVAPDVAEVLANLYADPQPLATALTRLPFTLVHGDYRSANLAITEQDGSAITLLDWQSAGYSPATVDLAWFLGMPSTQLASLTTTAAIYYYHQQLTKRLGIRFNQSDWQPMLALGVLTDILRIGCFRAWLIVHPVDVASAAAHQRVMAAYNDQVRTALKWVYE